MPLWQDDQGVRSVSLGPVITPHVVSRGTSGSSAIRERRRTHHGHHHAALGGRRTSSSHSQTHHYRPDSIHDPHSVSPSFNKHSNHQNSCRGTRGNNRSSRSMDKNSKWGSRTDYNRKATAQPLPTASLYPHSSPPRLQPPPPPSQDLQTCMEWDTLGLAWTASTSHLLMDQHPRSKDGKPTHAAGCTCQGTGRCSRRLFL